MCLCMKCPCGDDIALDFRHLVLLLASVKPHKGHFFLPAAFMFVFTFTLACYSVSAPLSLKHRQTSESRGREDIITTSRKNVGPTSGVQILPELKEDYLLIYDNECTLSGESSMFCVTGVCLSHNITSQARTVDYITIEVHCLTPAPIFFFPSGLHPHSCFFSTT